MNPVSAVFGYMRSQNWAGLSSMAGSLLILITGDMESAGATASFLVAETIFSVKGHTSWGYSLGCALIAFGDGLLPFSHATFDNPVLQATVGLFAATWIIGGLRYPLGCVAFRARRHAPKLFRSLIKIAVAIPPVIGILIFLQRLPALASATIGGNYVMLGAVSLWALADILLGRVQNYAKRAARLFPRATSYLAGRGIEL